MENWVDVPGFEGKYMVSDEGNIKSLNYRETKKEKIMVPQGNSGKYVEYLHIGLRNGGKKKVQYYMQRLVWEAFNGPIPKGMQVGHIDENPLNNRLDNLCLMTPKENCNYGTHNEKLRQKGFNRKDISRPVVQMGDNNEIIDIYPSQSEAARHCNCSSSNISQCCLGKIKTSGGYKWKCVDSFDPLVLDILKMEYLTRNLFNLSRG